MSFYSAVQLVANRVERVPTKERVFDLIDEAGLRNPETGYLSRDLFTVFTDPEARAENNRFFTPDSFDFWETIQVIWWDGDYDGPGYAISISGNGYFFPWELSDVRDRFLSLPKLLRFRQLVNEQFGGGFVFPKDLEYPLGERLMSDEAGWVWFGSESG